MAGAGLIDDPRSMTMQQRSQLAGSLRRQGASDEEIWTALGVSPVSQTAGLGDEVAPEDDRMSRLGAAGVILQQGAQSALEGISGAIQDYEGADAAADALDWAATQVGPSEDRERRLAERQEDMGILGLSADAIAGEAPVLAATIGAGMAAGSVVPGAGTFVGGLLGAAYGVSRMYDQGRDNVVRGKIAAQLGKRPEDVTAEEIERLGKGVTLDDSDKVRVAAAASTGALDAFPGARVLHALAPAKVTGIIAKNLGGQIIKEGAKTGVQEGLMEVGQELAMMALTDPEMRQKISELPEKDILEIGQLIAKERGQDLAVSFLAGFGLGGPAGGVAGGVTQSAANTQRKQELENLTGMATQVGVTPDSLNELAKDPEKIPELAAASTEITELNSRIDAINREIAEAPPEAAPQLIELRDKYESSLDKVVEQRFGNLGLKPKSRATVRAEAAADAEIKVNERKAKADRLGLQFAKDADIEAAESTIDALDAQVGEIQTLTRKLADAASPKRRNALNEKLDKQIKEASKTRADLANSVEGRDPVAAKKDFVAEMQAQKVGAQREQVVTRQYQRLQDNEDPVAAAQRIVDEAKPAKTKQEKEITKKIAGLERSRDGVTTTEEMDNIDAQIAAERAKLASDKPLLEAARRVLRDAGVDLPGSGKEQTGDTQTEPSQTGEPAATGKPKAAESDTGPAKPEPAPADLALQEAVVRDAERSLAVKETKIANDEALVAEAEARGEKPSAVVTRRLKRNRDQAATLRQTIAVNQPPPVTVPVQGPPTPAPETRQAELDAQYGAYQTVAEIPADSPLRQSPHGGYVDLMNDFGKVRTTPAEAQRWLREWTEASNAEATIVIDSDGRVLGAGTVNDDNASPIPQVAYEAMQDPNRQVRFLHSHPKETPLSGADIRMLKKYPGLSVMEAVLPSGRVVRATPAERAIDLDPTIVDIVQTAALPDTTGLSRERIATVKQEAMLRALADGGFISYNPDIRLSGQKEIRDATDRAISALQGRTDTGVGTDVGPAAGPVAPSAQGPSTVRPEQSGRAGGDPSRGDGIGLAAGRDLAYPEFTAAFRAGTPANQLIRRPEFKAAVADMMTLEPTSRMEGFDTVDWHANRQYTIDGQQVTGTAQAIPAFLASAKTLAAQGLNRPVKPIVNGRTVTIITGPPASGKSTIANEMAYDTGAAIIDSDEYKQALPEFGKGEGANAVHHESKGIATAMEDILISEGANIVYPKVGHEIGSTEKLARKFKGAGYKVNIVNLNVPSNEAMRRMLGRFGEKGRLIPPDYLLGEVGDNPQLVHKEMEAKGEFDGYAELDGLSPYGRKPDVLSQTGSPLAGTGFEAPSGSPAQRGSGAPEPGTAGNREPELAAGIDPDVRVKNRANTVDREKAGEMGTEIADIVQARYDRNSSNGWPVSTLMQGVNDGTITQDMIVDAISDTADHINMEIADAVDAAAEALFPGVRQRGGEALQDARTQGLKLINLINESGHGKLFRTKMMAKPKYGNNKIEVSVLRADDKLKDYLGFTVRGTSKFRSANEDPNDLSGVKLQPTNIMAGEALDRAKAAIVQLQQQNYRISQSKLDALTWEDMLGDDLETLKIKYGDDLKIQKAAAEAKLERLRTAAAAVGPEGLSFRYRIDDKGRIYADGEFTPQSSEVVKYLFEAEMPDGSYMPLSEMMEVDHTGSGWQIAQVIARDDILSPVVNTQAGLAGNALAPIGDIYNRTKSAMEDVIRRDAAAGNEMAQMALDKIIGDPAWQGDKGRKNIKPAVIAINYGGGKKNFRDALGEDAGFYAKLADKDGTQPAGFWSYMDNAGIRAVDEMGPATKRFKDWSINALKAAIATAEFRNTHKDLKWTVGRDGQYKDIVYKEEPDTFQVRDKDGDMKYVRRDKFRPKPTEEVDVGGTARTIFSQIIQGLDAAIIHEGIDLYKSQSDGAFVSPNHDSYTVPPAEAGKAASAIRQSMYDVLSSVNVPDRILAEIDAQIGIDAVNEFIEEYNAERNSNQHLQPLAPFDEYGSYDPESIKTSAPAWQETSPKSQPPFEGFGSDIELARGIDAGEAFSQFGVSPDMQARSTIDLMYSGKPTPTFPSNKGAAEYLQDLTPAADRVTDFTKPMTPEQRTKIANLMAAEAKAALDFRGEGSAADWYTSAMSRAMEIATIKYPMMTDETLAKEAGFVDPEDARFAFLFSMATASQNLDVRANAVAAMKAYDKLLANMKDGVYSFGEGVGTGAKAPAMQANYDKFATLLNSKALSVLPPAERVSAMRKLFNEKMPLRDWEAAFKSMGLKGFTVGQTAKDVEVYGSAFLGPKIGNGFYQNLNGNYSPITIDLWARRMWGRMTGKSIGLENAFEPQRKRLAISTKRSFQQAGDNDVRTALRDTLKAAKERQDGAKARLKEIEAGDRKGIGQAKKDVTAANQEVSAIEEQLADVSNLRVPEPWKPEYDTDNDAYLAYAQRLKRAWDKEFKALQQKKLSKADLDAAQPTWAKAAKSVVSSQTTPLDQVNNATQRKDIEATMREAIETLGLSGLDISPADLQAILWYPEKDLWNSLSSEQTLDEDGVPVVEASTLNESYDTVIADILEDQGYDVSGAERNASRRSEGRRTGSQPAVGDAGRGRGAGQAGTGAAPQAAEGVANANTTGTLVGDQLGGPEGPQAVEGRTPELAAGIDDLVGTKRGVTDATVKREAQRLVDTGRSTPNAVLAGLRHDDSLFSYDKLMNDATKRDGKDYGPDFMATHAGFTKGMVAKLAGLAAAEKRPLAAKFYMDMVKAQKNDHIAKLNEGLKRGSIEASDIDIDTRMYKGTRVPEMAAGVDLEVPGYMQGAVKASEVMNDYKQRILNPGATNRSFWEYVEDNFFNRFAPIKRLEQSIRSEKGLGKTLAQGAESMFKMAEIAANDAGRTFSLMFEGAADITKEGGYGVAKGTMGLRQIFDMVGTGQNMVDWMSYMIAKDAKGRKAAGFKVPLTDAEIDAGIKKGNPTFDRAASEWKKYNDANIDFLVKTGRITKKQADALKSNPNYVPLYRSTDIVEGKEKQIYGGVELDLSSLERRGGRGGKGEIAPGRNPGIRKQKGGDTLQIDNLLTNMMKNSEAIAAAGMRNMAANNVFDALGNVGMTKKIRATQAKTKPNGAIKMWDNGKEYWVVPVTPEAVPVMTALVGLEPVKLGRFLSLAATVGAIFRQGVTLSPAFMIRNAIRGAVSAGVTTSWANIGQHGNTISGFRQALRKDDATKSFMRQSGMGDYRFGNQDAGFGKDDILIEYGLGAKTAAFRIRQFMNKLEDVGMATELADRLATYNNLRAQGVPDTEAAWQAQNIINYGRKGGLAELRALLPMVPFLNARLQGLARLAEGAAARDASPQEKAKAMQRLVVAALPLMAFGAAAWAWNNGDDERREKYKSEPMWRRQNYHIIYAGDKTLLIPKAFEIGHLFSTLPEMFADAMVNDMGGELVPGVRQMIGQTLLFNAIPAAALPFIEGAANYSFFTGQPIVGQREQDLRAEDRTANTSSLSRFVGRQLGISDLTKVSPTMIEHFFQGYGGAYYLAAASAMDMVGAEAGLIPGKPAGAFGDIPVVSAALERALGSMVKDTASTTDKYLQEFYSNKDHITQIYRSAKAAASAGDMETANQILASAEGTPQAYKIMNKAGARMGKINAQIRLIQNTRDMSPGEKREKIRVLTQQRNALARQVSTIIDRIEDKQGTTFRSAA